MPKTIKKELAKLDKVPHPQSRKTAKLLRGIQKDEKKKKAKKAQFQKLVLVGEKVLWFQNNVNFESPLTPQTILELIERYLDRFNEELEQIDIKHSIGNRSRQHANRQDIINITKKIEFEEFNGPGLEMPDLLNRDQVKVLKTWNTDLKYLQHFHLKRISRKMLEDKIEKGERQVLDKPSVPMSEL